MPDKKTRSKVSKRSVKRVVSKTRKTTQRPSSKVRNYRKAYEACVEKAMEACAKRNKMLDKKPRKPKNTKSASKKTLSKKGTTKSIKKARRVKKTKDEKTVYQDFVSKQMKNPDIKGLNAREKLKKINELWSERSK